MGHHRVGVSIYSQQRFLMDNGEPGGATNGVSESSNNSMLISCVLLIERFLSGISWLLMVCVNVFILGFYTECMEENGDFPLLCSLTRG